MALEVEINGMFGNGLTQTITYTDATPTAHTMTGIFVPGVSNQILDTTLEMQMRMGSLYIHEDTFGSVTYTPRIDTATVGGVVYTVTERRLIGGVYHFILERQDIDNIRGRGRRY